MGTLTYRERIERHERLLTMYQRSLQYADLLDAAGNFEKAREVRMECRAVALQHDLDKILEGN